VTTATILYNETVISQPQQCTRTQSKQEEFFNYYWAKYCMRQKQGFSFTCLPVSPKTVFQQVQNTFASEEESIAKILQPAITEPKISQKNLKLIKFLDQWMTEPDDLGEEFWEEFCKDIEKNRFTI
jgi:hypothetical protein